MQDLFTTLTRAVEGNAVLALSAAVTWGILSIVLSPCHLASIPLIVGFIDSQGRTATRRAFLISLLFSVGILITIGLIGVLTALAGRMMGDVGRYGNYAVAAIFFLVGLHLLEVIPCRGRSRTVNIRRKGAGRIHSGPGVRDRAWPLHVRLHGAHARRHVQTRGYEPPYGVMLLLAYGLGHCSVIVFAGTFTGVIQKYLNWNERSKRAVLLKRICGVLVILGGLWMIYAAP